ncbi:MAG: efflux RND transporter periplasmic adaptor subunit [Phycisphaerae bacterium]
MKATLEIESERPTTGKSVQAIGAAEPNASVAMAPVHHATRPRGTVIGKVMPVVLVIAALTVGAVLIQTPPQVPRAEVEALTPVVEVIPISSQQIPVEIQAYGTVIPAREISVMPEVSGRIVALHDQLKAGGNIGQRELLLKIDPTDYEIAVAQAQADLNVAENELQRVQAGIASLAGRRDQLEIEIEFLQWNAERFRKLAEQDSAGEAEARDAVTKLRSQQAARSTLEAQIFEQEQAVATASARVQVSGRRLEAARIALERTEVRAPFDAIVTRESIEVGQLVTPQSSVATLVANDEFWVEASVPLKQFQNIKFADDDATDASQAQIEQAAIGLDQPRAGVALRALGDLDPLGRMGRLLVSLPDPLNVSRNEGHPVRLGSYVKLRLSAGVVDGVFPVPRKALRENDHVWVRDENGCFAIRSVDVVWRRHQDVLVRNGFEAGDTLIISHLSSAIPGMPLRTSETKSSEDSTATTETNS